MTRNVSRRVCAAAANRAWWPRAGRLHGDVVAELVADERGAGGQRRRRRGRHGQRLVLDDDEIARVLGDRAALGDDRGSPPRRRAAPCPPAGVRREPWRNVVPGTGLGMRAGHGWMSATSSADTTASTPGSARAAVASIRVRRVGVRAPHHRRVSHARHLEIVHERARPVSSRAVLPTRDRRADSRPRACAGRRPREYAARRDGRARAPSSPGARRGGRNRRRGRGRTSASVAGRRRHECQHRVDHSLVAGAAAEVAGQRVADLLLARSRVVAERRGQRHQMPPAEAALTPWCRTNPPERVQRVGAAASPPPSRPACRRPAPRAAGSAHGLPSTSARAADPCSADVGAGQPERLAQEVHERRPRLRAPLRGWLFTVRATRAQSLRRAPDPGERRRAQRRGTPASRLR